MNDIVQLGFGRDFATPYAALINFLTTESNHIENVSVTDAQLQRLLRYSKVPSNVNMEHAIVARNLFWTTRKVVEDALNDACLTIEYLVGLLHMMAGGTHNFLLLPETFDGVRDTCVSIGGKELNQEQPVITQQLNHLLKNYENASALTVEDIAECHIEFEKVHPFVDFNGRIGRLIMLHQSIQAGMKPATIMTRDKEEYYQVFDMPLPEGITQLTKLIGRACVAEDIYFTN